MIGNLVSNAIKYTPPGRKVLMSARVRSAGLVVDICDQGVGIPGEELDNVFLEFYKVENASVSAEGFGLGLSIVSRLARALNTRVSLRSELGRGTVFRLVIGHVDDDTGNNSSHSFD
ncbi:sensor histidine kinase [Variovorax sp. LjRoot84]|uniref:sensor histidine kinase n=1 Tax=unclassified Variovorax TaxID=663243 RepID=UPI003ED0BD1C